jgi:hypothetical protein
VWLKLRISRAGAVTHILLLLRIGECLVILFEQRSCCLCSDMSTKWPCFVLIHCGHRVALFDVGILRNCLRSRRRMKAELCGPDQL